MAARGQRGRSGANRAPNLSTQSQRCITNAVILSERELSAARRARVEGPCVSSLQHTVCAAPPGSRIFEILSQGSRHGLRAISCSRMPRTSALGKIRKGFKPHRDVTSLVMQRYHGVHPHGAARGNGARGQRHQGQQHRNRSVGDGIGGADRQKSAHHLGGG